MSERGHEGSLFFTGPFCFFKLFHGGWKGERKGMGMRGGKEGKEERSEGESRGRKGRKRREGI